MKGSANRAVPTNHKQDATGQYVVRQITAPITLKNKKYSNK